MKDANNKTEQRESKRLSLLQDDMTLVNTHEFYLEIDLDGTAKGKIIDISLKGICVEIPELKPLQLKKMINQDDYFVKLHLGNEFFVIGVKNIWHKIIENRREKIYKGGINFEIIPPEDMLKLSAIIKEIRELKK